MKLDELQERLAAFLDRRGIPAMADWPEGRRQDRGAPVVLVSVLAAVGTSGVPGGGYIGEYLICVFFFPEQMAIAFCKFDQSLP